MPALSWPCPFTLPVSERPAWAVPPIGFESDQLPCSFGASADTCTVPGCTCVALDSDGLCEGHWLDTK